MKKCNSCFILYFQLSISVTMSILSLLWRFTLCLPSAHLPTVRLVLAHVPLLSWSLWKHWLQIRGSFMKTWPWRSSPNTALETPGKASETVSLMGKTGRQQPDVLYNLTEWITTGNIPRPCLTDNWGGSCVTAGRQSCEVTVTQV